MEDEGMISRCPTQMKSGLRRPLASTMAATVMPNRRAMALSVSLGCTMYTVVSSELTRSTCACTPGAGRASWATDWMGGEGVIVARPRARGVASTLSSSTETRASRG